MEIATFAAGCFWGVEDTFRHVKGVLKTQVGYTGGHKANPTYQEVCAHNTGHAEAVEIQFDPKSISFEELIEIFWESHDPTTLNRQGVDVGTQYRSEIFYHSEEQRQQAETSKQQWNNSGKLKGPIVTAITKASTFYPAEEYHQCYFEKQGIKGGCHKR